MNIALDAKRAFHNTRGLGNYSRDLIRILQEHEIGHLYLFNPQKRKFLGVKIDNNTTEITPQSFFGRNSSQYPSLRSHSSYHSRPHLYALPTALFLF